MPRIGREEVFRRMARGETIVVVTPDGKIPREIADCMQYLQQATIEAVTRPLPTLEDIQNAYGNRPEYDTDESASSATASRVWYAGDADGGSRR